MLDRKTIASLISGSLYEDATQEQCKFCDHIAGIILAADAATPSPLASVEAGRGEREVLARAAQPFVDFFNAAEERYRKRGGDPHAFGDNTPFIDINAKELPLGLWRALRAALSQGNGETVAWRCRARSANTGANDPQDCDWPVCGCDPYADKVIEALEESGKFTPPSQPEGVREALEKIEALAKKYDSYSTDDPRIYKTDENCRGIFGQIAWIACAALTATTTPSPGLVEAAEWHEEQAQTLRKANLWSAAETHERSAQHFRTFSAKGTANADGGRNG